MEALNFTWSRFYSFGADFKPLAPSGQLLTFLVDERDLLVEIIRTKRQELALAEYVRCLQIVEEEARALRHGDVTGLSLGLEPNSLLSQFEELVAFEDPCCCSESAEIGAEHLREMVRRLRERCRLLSLAIRLLLDLLFRPLFLHQIVIRERAWSLFHGSHPPRQRPGVGRPVAAELGRVRSSWPR